MEWRTVREAGRSGQRPSYAAQDPAPLSELWRVAVSRAMAAGSRPSDKRQAERPRIPARGLRGV